MSDPVEKYDTDFDDLDDAVDKVDASAEDQDENGGK